MLTLGIHLGAGVGPPKRWSLNKQYFNDEDWVKFMGSEIKEFLIWNNKSAPMNVVWDSLKAFIRGLIISKDAATLKKAREDKKSLEQKVQVLHTAFLYHPSASNKCQLDRAKRELSTNYYIQSEAVCQQHRQKTYEESNFTGRFLAWQAREQAVANQIKALICPVYREPG